MSIKQVFLSFKLTLNTNLQIQNLIVQGSYAFLLSFVEIESESFNLY